MRNHGHWTKIELENMGRHHMLSVLMSIDLDDGMKSSHDESCFLS